MRFCPGDIILFRLSGWGLLNPLVRWLIGKYGHVAVFYAYTKRELPLCIESIGRGVLIRTLLASRGRKVAVYRWKGEDAERVGLKVAKAAEHLADNPESGYDFFGIARFLLPRFLFERLGIPFEWYKADKRFICSELVWQAYKDAGYLILTDKVMPLPSDFAFEDKLEKIWEGKL